MDTPSSASTSRFHFRDQKYNMVDEDLAGDRTESESWSVSSGDSDDEVELQSMTAKGIKHLCSELHELKKESDEDFQKNVLTNYLSFLGISKGVRRMESELALLKSNASTQKRLIQDLTDKTSLLDLEDETMQQEETFLSNIPFPGILEAHTEDISDILDTLLSERRLDEALRVLQIEEQSFRSMVLEGKFPSDEVILYDTAISERRAMLADQLALIAENPRVSVPELQKALVGLSKLGETHLATGLLLKYYHSRVASELNNLHSSIKYSDGQQIQGVAKYIFSMISQAATSYIALHGEAYPYPSELIQWASEETKVFAVWFNKYVEFASEISGGLSSVVEAVHFAMSYCSLLEAQKIILLPYLTKHIRPCMERILQIHVNHYKNIISIFTLSDAWNLEKYLVSRILAKGSSSYVVGRHPEYCMLTSSGWKFITLYQDLAEDISPLVSLHMEGSVLRALMDIFTQYVIILEGALKNDATIGERGKQTSSLVERIPILANLSTVLQLFLIIIEDICGGSYNLKFEINSYELFIQDTYDRLRAQFCQQFIQNIMSPQAVNKSVLHCCTGLQDDSDGCYQEPSACYQELYLELGKLQKLSEDNHVEVDWLVDLLRELMDALFLWISSGRGSFSVGEELSMDQHCINFMQFILNIQFLVEIARCGGYLSDNMMNVSLEITSRAESVFTSAGLNPKRYIADDRWAEIAASKALKKLQELETKETLVPEVTKEFEVVREEAAEYYTDLSSTTGASENSAEPDSATVDPSEFADNAIDFPYEESDDRRAAESSDPCQRTGLTEVDRRYGSQATILEKPDLIEDPSEDNCNLSDGNEQLM